MRQAWAGFVTALVAASTTPLCSGSAFAQQLPTQAVASQPAPEADAPQSAQEPADQAAANCPGHPDALGTSRVLALDPTKYPRVGSMQYPGTHHDAIYLKLRLGEFAKLDRIGDGGGGNTVSPRLAAG